MQHEALLYSIDPTITKTQLQQSEEILYDQSRYLKMKEWVKTENIRAMFAVEHPKFALLKLQSYIIYYIGDISLLDKKILCIIGPRKMSTYGKNVVESLFVSMSEYDIITISGMAEGVDQLCHSLSINNAIPTIAVLGGGIGWYAKRPERNIIQQIVASGGLVISEFRLLEQPTHYSFPQRNRIIAGISDLLFLPEAGKNSGSLITVDFALSMKKPVYATPASIFSPTSQGILQLMESGHVKPIIDLKGFLHQHFTSRDIPSRTLPTLDLTDQEQGLLDIIAHDHNYSFQTLLQETKYDTDDLIQLLTMLEIKGLIYQETPGSYILT